MATRVRLRGVATPSGDQLGLSGRRGGSQFFQKPRRPSKIGACSVTGINGYASTNFRIARNAWIGVFEINGMILPAVEEGRFSKPETPVFQ